MRILFVTIGAVYNMEDSGAYTDLLRKFSTYGHDVYVVGSQERRSGSDTYMTKECGINVLRVRIGNITKTGLFEKGISTLLIGMQYQMAIRQYFKNIKFDLILYTTPPITIASLVRKLKKRDEAYTYLMLKDIFPQNSVDLGMLSKKGLTGIIYRYFRQVEKKLYKVSDKIGCMSQANVQYLVKQDPDIPLEKIEVCPNTISPLCKLHISSRDAVLQKYNIPRNKILLMYGGNFGKPQNVDFVVEALSKCTDILNIHFIMCGSGTDFYKLQNYCDTQKPGHVTVIQHLPFSEYIELISCCNVGLLFLDYRFKIPNFPSRLLDYMNVGLPVIAATDNNTDVGQVIEMGNFGWWIESKDPEAYHEMLKKIFSLKNVEEVLKEKSICSSNYLERHYRTDVAYNTILQAYGEKK